MSVSRISSEPFNFEDLIGDGGEIPVQCDVGHCTITIVICSGRRNKTHLSRFIVGTSWQIWQVSKITKITGS
jgi:hypothetical protein